MIQKPRLALFLLASLALAPMLVGQKPPKWSNLEKPILKGIQNLRSLSDDKRPSVTRELAISIRGLPKGRNKVLLADGLAHLSTEGDSGENVLQEVADTLAGALNETPFPDEANEPAEPYRTLANLTRYDHLPISLDAGPYKQALIRLEQIEKQLDTANFSLQDLTGKTWTLRDLRGKVVLVNFWASWCPPCVREMPELQLLHNRFKDDGLVILGISPELPDTVKSFTKSRRVTYPILLDRDHAVMELFKIEGIPNTFLYDREGRLASQARDSRTRRQFLEMLAKVGLQ